MALTDKQRERLEKLSIEQGGVAFVNKSAKATPTATLVISLGGLGGDTLNELKRKMLRNIGESGHIAFLAIDTDETSMNAIKRSTSDTGYLNDREVFAIYDPASAQILLDRGRNRPTFTDKWMQRPFPETLLDDTGAQGVRQIGRLMLTCGSAYMRLRTRISDMIDEVGKSVGDEVGAGIAGGVALKDLEVILIAGVSGGTGSGTIIDVSYLIRTVMKEKNLDPGTYNLSAYIYTPDVQFNETGIRTSPSIQSNLRRNGYAAIKEIDYFMNLASHHGKYVLDIGTQKFECEENIYESCTIVTGLAASGGMFTKKTAIDNLTENLMDLLTDITYTQGGMQVQMAKAFSSNKRTTLQSWYKSVGGDVKQYPKAANYCYQVLGYSSVGIPKDEILAYCVNKMFQAVYKEFTHFDDVDGDMVRNVMSRANIMDVEGYVLQAESMDMEDPIRMPSFSPREYPSRADIRNGQDTVLDDARAMAYDEAQKINNRVFRGRLKSSILRALNNDIDAIFDAHGPYFVIELLTHRADQVMDDNDPRQNFSGILECISVMEQQLVDAANNCMGASKKYAAQIQWLADSIPAVMSGKKIEEYVNYCCRIAWTEVYRATLYNVLFEILQEVRTELVTTNNKIWRVYTDVLDTVSRILSKDGAYATDSRRVGHTYSYNIINLYDGDQKTQQLQSYLDGLISPTTIAKLTSSFIISMRDKREEWIEQEDMQKFDVVKEVRSIFDDCLNSELKTDIMEKFVVAAYSPSAQSISDIDQIFQNGGKQKTDALAAAAKQIKMNLDTRGGLMASPISGFNIGIFNDKSMVAALTDTPNLSKELFALYPGSTTKAHSNGLTKYISSQIVFNVPLYLFNGFKECDEVYRRCIGNDKGLHMDEVIQDWRRFPQPYILDMAVKDGMPYKEFEDYQILMRIKEEADKAMEYGFIRIEKDQNGSEQTCYTLLDVVRKPADMGKFRDMIVEMARERDGDDDSEELTLREVMENPNSGYEAVPVPIELDNSALDPTDLEGRGRYLEVGDFYKLIRMSIRYMDMLRKNLEIWDEANEVFGDVHDTMAHTMDYQRRLRIFIDSLKTELIGFVGDKKLTMYYTQRGERHELIDVKAEAPVDKKYLLYHAYHKFFELDEMAHRDMRQKARQLLQDDVEADLSELRDKIEDIMNSEDGLRSMYAKQDLAEDLRDTELDYTFREDLTVKGSPYENLKRFYTVMQRRLNN